MITHLQFSKALVSTGIVLMAVMGFTRVPTTVSGNVNPVDAALHAFLYSTTDTVSCNVDNGTGRFEFPSVKPGTYQLLLEAKPPYRNNGREGIQVADGRPNDVGVIDMQK